MKPREVIRQKAPKAYMLMKRLKRFRQWCSTPQTVFTNIYKKRGFGDAESASGPGSSLEETAQIRKELPGVIKRLGIATLLDVPCGDLHWMKEVDLGLQKYIGADIVGELIQQIRRHYGCVGREFLVLDIIRDPIPKADAILCRDCLLHFSFSHIMKALNNLRNSGAHYFLTTTYVKHSRNEDIVTGQGHLLNLRLAPFNFPEPLILIDERSKRSIDRSGGKSLGVWEFAQLGHLPPK